MKYDHHESLEWRETLDGFATLHTRSSKKQNKIPTSILRKKGN